MPGQFDIGLTDGNAAPALLATTARGDIPRRGSAGIISPLAVGAAGRVLTSDGTDPSWGQAAKIINAQTFSSAKTVASTSLVSILGSSYTIPAGVLAVGDQIVFEGAATVLNSAGANRTYSMNVGPFMAADWAAPTAHATTTTRIYTWRLVTTIVSTTSQASHGWFQESATGTAGSVFDVGTLKIWNATSSIDTTATSTYDVKMLSTSATGTQEASLVAATVLHIPKATFA